MRRSLLAACAITLAVGVACSSDATPIVTGGRVTFQGSDARLTVRIADSPDEQRQGLMGVEDLSPDRGMAFVYDEPTTGSFWMKDTPIPLSIAFVDETGRIVGIEEMTPCTSEPCATWDAGGAAYTLAVEANAGWFADHGIEVGDRAELTELAYA